MQEEEYGVYRFSAIEFATIQKLLFNTWAKYIDDSFEAAAEVAQKISENRALSGNKSWINKEIDNQCKKRGISVSVNYGDAESPLQKFLQRNSHGLYSYLCEKSAKDMKQQKSKDKPKIAYQCTLGHLTVNSTEKTVSWSVAADKLAVERSKEHPVAAAFFERLSSVRWNAKTGGYCRFIDDSLRVDTEGLGFLFTHCYGTDRDRQHIRI